MAAGKTPGLIWLHSRYAEKLRAESGRDGVGAQRLFRYLGAETAPRLVEHPAHFQRFAYAEGGVDRNGSWLAAPAQCSDGRSWGNIYVG